MVHVMIAVHGQGELLHIVKALGPGCCLAHFLHRRHQHRYQDADDGDHHQQFDQGKAGAIGE